MKEAKDIRTLLNNFISKITPEDDIRVLEREEKLQEEKRLTHYRQTVPERFLKSQSTPTG